MRTSEDTGARNQLRCISWWASVLVGVLAGTTLTWIRTQRNFFFIGAVIIAVVIVVLGLRTIRRRARFPQMAQARVSWLYAFWAIILMILVGPLQLVYVADDLSELMLKSLILSAGFCVAIHEIDRSLVNASTKNFRGA
ncbi:MULTISPECIES: hypothetical protein [Glutamicibacter]|uniref:Uncharacterized protein n=1 Tax=Glutamicibacter halophytocola TaxID=1933880 RepID=A0AA95BUA1_9MICC|nr:MULTISPECIES: hypothetical protein [Glutamicibacter]MBF6672661.1 hypothetical protein [Glutamicibacter sp. FBE19]NQD39550.1 hypothetical protein [Glutamicibacter halophytocola]UUX59593.1 hypothetical protein NUH22_02900 [Glutamicibacter halophytocola]